MPAVARESEGVALASKDKHARWDRRGRTRAGMLWIFALWAIAGCSSKPDYRFEHLELLPSQEEVLEFPLGDFAIPVPAIGEKLPFPIHGGNRLQIEFTLSAVIAPHDQPHILEAWQHSQGRIRDQVIRICRNASVQDLAEPELVTLKMRMLDAVEPYLGRNQLRSLVVPKVEIYKL